jgi:hypothetical protein
MSKWTVGDDTQGDLFVAESRVDGLVSLHMPAPDPVVVTIQTAEHIRLVIGSAIGEAQLGRSS